MNEFKDTCLYGVSKSITNDFINMHWYYILLALPIIIFSILLCIPIAVIVDFYRACKLALIGDYQ